MKYAIFKAGILAACMFGAQGLAFAENPLFLPKVETGPELMSAAETDGLKKEAEALKRKAELLKAAAGKKYAAASELRIKAGGFRSDSSRKGELLRSKAEQSAEVSSMIGDLFGLMSGMGGMGGGQLSQNAALTSALTGKMIQGQQAGAAKDVMAAHGQAGQLSMEAEKKAGPLEMRADELENEGNRLMEAHNRLIGIANAKSLLVASEELLRKVDADGRRMERLKEVSREFVASMSGR
ncbi:MAG: hypothetical protein M0Z38_08630 [Deltaproteobacteria bacterium]|nr:hypothetical protein [Deltaproteobacteria bacterium]